MKKRILSLLTALCLMLTLAPAAFAADSSSADSQPDTITLPNGQVVEIPDVEAPNVPMTLSEGTEDNTISSAAELLEKDAAFWYSGKTIYVTGDLNFSDYTNRISEWGGYIQYFYGTLQGVLGDYDNNGELRYPKVLGIPDNCGLIYGIIGGTIENLVFEHSVSTNDGGASFITFMPTNLNGIGHHLTMKDITVTGDISLTGSDQSNYSPFVFCVSTGGLTMENCVNKANISGSIYGSVFYGYYPLYATSYVFDNCVNYGDITMQYAGMFFGNSSTLETKLNNSALSLSITDCANYGSIRGTSGASYLVAPVASSSIGTVANAVNDILESGTTSDSTSIPSTISVSQVSTTDEEDNTLNGTLCTGAALTGFAAALSANDSTTLTVTRADDESNVDHYTVAVSAYVNLWYNGDAVTPAGFNGTDRYTVTQNIYVEGDLTDNDDGTFQPDLKVYGFADSDVGEYECDIDDYEVYKYNNNFYYRISDNMEEGIFSLYVSSEVDEDGQPVGGGTKNAQIVTVAAYSADGTMLDCVTVSLN